MRLLLVMLLVACGKDKPTPSSGSAETAKPGPSALSDAPAVARCKQLVPEAMRDGLDVLGIAVPGTVNCTLQGTGHKAVWLVNIECPGGTLAVPADRQAGVGKASEKTDARHLKFNATNVQCLVTVSGYADGDTIAFAKAIDANLNAATMPPR